MEQFDLTEFAKMFDAALASDNPAVQKALRNFMMVTALVHAQEDGDERIMGPLETLIKKVGDLESLVRELHYNRTTKTYPTKSDYWKDYYGNTPTWTYSPNTSVSTTSATEWKDSYGYSAQDLSKLMKDLKFNDTD